MPSNRRRGKTVSDLIPPAQLEKLSRPPTPIQQRIIDGVALSVEQPETPQSLLFQHTVLCQTCLPYRDPGDDVRRWERKNGSVSLQVNAGEAMHPEQERFVPLGLPFGPKARMILMHINQQALRQDRPEIEIQHTLTGFVRETLDLDPKGRNMRIVKDQLARLSASSIRLGLVRDGKATTVNSQIISSFDIWFPKDDRQRVLWPSTIRLSLDYWESLKAHAVPLDENHIARLSHSALALDIYAWLANRLHRVQPGKPQSVSWVALHGQFGHGYARIDHFRAAFRVALTEVLTLYHGANVADDHHRGPVQLVSLDDGKTVFREAPASGLRLYHSPSPVSRRA